MVDMACIMGRFMVLMMFMMLVVLLVYRLVFKVRFDMINRCRWVRLRGNISRNMFFAADVLWYYAQHRSLCWRSCLLWCIVVVRLPSRVLLPQ
jgi:hypothetical protein